MKWNASFAHALFARIGSALAPVAAKLEGWARRLWAQADVWVEKLFGGPQDRKNAQDAEIVQSFRSDATAIEEAPIGVSIYAAFYVVLVVLVVAVLWAVFGTVDRIVVAQGKIATRTPLVVMQPFVTSRILKIFVKAGDHVHAGQILIAFDPALAQADVASTEQQERATSAEVDRIQAELANRPYELGPGANAEQAAQAQIYAQRTAQFAAEMSQRDSRERAVTAQISSDNASIAGLRQQVVIAKKIVGVRQYLESQKAGAPLDVWNAQSNEIDLEAKLKGLIADAAKLSQQRGEMQAERKSFLDQWQSDLNQKLVDAMQKHAQATETLNKAHKYHEFTVLKAPVDATVLELADRSVGSVLREAETLVTLVPDNAGLYVEANIPSRDVGFVAVGEPLYFTRRSACRKPPGKSSNAVFVCAPGSSPPPKSRPASARSRLTC
jgi:hemolysin D